MKSHDYTFNCQFASNTFRWLCPIFLFFLAFMWNIQYNIYEVHRHTACTTANFQLKYLILKATEAACSWSRNNVASFHLALLHWKSPVHSFSDSAISVWLAVSNPWASKIHWSSANNLSSMETNDYNSICPPHLSKPIHECTVCCWHDGMRLLSSEYFSTVRPSNAVIAHFLSLS